MLGLDSPKCPVKDNVDAEKIGGLSQSCACAWGLEVNLCRASGTLPCTRFSHLQPSRVVGARQEVGTSKRRRCHPKRTSLALFSKTPPVSQVIPCHFPSAYSSQDVVLRLPDHRFLSFGRSQSEHSFPQPLTARTVSRLAFILSKSSLGHFSKHHQQAVSSSARQELDKTSLITRSTADPQANKSL